MDNIEMLDADDDHTGRADFWAGVILGWASGVLFALVVWAVLG